MKQSTLWIVPVIEIHERLGSRFRFETYLFFPPLKQIDDLSFPLGIMLNLVIPTVTFCLDSLQLRILQ